MDATMRAQQSGAEVIARFMQALEARDLDAALEMIRDEAVMFWPQSGERFRGRDNIAGAMRAQEDMPTMEGEPEVIGSGDVWTMHTRLRYGQDLYHYVGVFELAEGKLARSREYFAPPFPANPARAPFSED